MPDITMCANATPHCGKTFQCYRSTDSGTKPSWHQSWASFEGGKDCPSFWEREPAKTKATQP
ncbi:MAG: hypothetical protein Q8R82_01625 [Hyphomonadaceae bacterium]|nr:hypothetical protein [Hyphomonadaceae bacterium]